MANITVDLTEKAHAYVEGLYSDRVAIMHNCERIAEFCKSNSGDSEIDAIGASAREIYISTQRELKAIDDALAALHLFLSGGYLCSDMWPSNFNRIRRYIKAREGMCSDTNAVFRAVLSVFGITYTCNEASGVTIRYTTTED